MQLQIKAVRATRLTIFSKIGAKNYEHQECIFMTIVLTTNFKFILNGWNLYFNNSFDQCAQCQNKAARAAALTIFSKMGAKNREHNECILMTLFALWEEGIFAKNEQEIILTAKHSCKAGTFYTPSNEQWCIFIISLTVKIYWLFH